MRAHVSEWGRVHILHALCYVLLSAQSPCYYLRVPVMFTLDLESNKFFLYAQKPAVYTY